ncbi:MAG TPA: NAD(P)H-dependent oxidoreductase [Myxococcaceae bacterium]|nr:NAD(P)H-dependent oxidoreductase [Myxococcaceae bacterium]
MRILAVCGSLQAKSANLELLKLAAATAPEGVEIILFSGLDRLPHFNPDLEAGGAEAPAAVTAWRRALAESDAVLISSPEYGFSLPGVLKNGVDWVIGSGELERKVVAVTAAVPGPARGRMGLQALQQTLGAVRARIVGGEPIARGESFEREVRALVSSLVEAARAARAGDDSI